MVIDLPAHDRRLANHGVGEVRSLGGGSIHDDGQRRLERMREVARMRSRLLGLSLGMREQRVQFLDQRLHFERQRLGDAVGTGRAHRLDRAAHVAQREQPVPGLQGGHQQQAQRKNDEAVDQDRADRGDLRFQFAGAGSHGEPPLRIAAGQDDRALHHAQRLARELQAVVDMRLGIEMVAAHFKRAIP